jgi:hypothetical protein
VEDDEDPLLDSPDALQEPPLDPPDALQEPPLDSPDSLQEPSDDLVEYFWEDSSDNRSEQEPPLARTEASSRQAIDYFFVQPPDASLDPPSQEQVPVPTSVQMEQDLPMSAGHVPTACNPPDPIQCR